MRVFISQPMKEKTDAEIENERRRAIESIKTAYPDEDIKVIDSFFKDAPHIANPLWCLSDSIKLLSTADLAFFSKGWQDARGCRIEFECAEAYGIKLMIEELENDDASRDNTCEDHEENKKISRSESNEIHDDEMQDSVSSPAHYKLEGLDVESIDVIQAVLGGKGFDAFCRGNALKYLIRANKKNGVEDLKKARVYLEWEIGGLGHE